MRILILLLALKLGVTGFCGPSQVLAMNPDKRLKAVISSDSMNRLAVTNDRITQIFGDQEAYEVQTEENTGQLFLKPTSDNGKKPLAITLITESGVTQDMSLEPQERDAATVILKNTETGSTKNWDTKAGVPNGIASNPHVLFSQASSYSQGLGEHAPPFGAALGFQDLVIAAMKTLVSGLAPTVEVETFDRSSPKGFKIGLIEAVNLGNFRGYKLDVKNTSDLPMDIVEKDFYRAGDLAFSCERRVLNPKTSTVLYVVTKI